MHIKRNLPYPGGESAALYLVLAFNMAFWYSSPNLDMKPLFNRAYLIFLLRDTRGGRRGVVATTGSHSDLGCVVIRSGLQHVQRCGNCAEAAAAAATVVWS